MRNIKQAMKLIAIISLGILIISIIFNLILGSKERKERYNTFFTSIIGLSSTFLGITLGLYFNEIEVERQNRASTFKYLEVALSDVETVQGMMFDGYKDELGKYYGKHIIKHDSVLNVGILRSSEIPFPVTLETILKSDIYPKHLPSRLYDQLNFCFHNSANYKKLIQNLNTDTSKLQDQQLLKDTKDYISLLGFCHYIIETELNFEKDIITNAEAESEYIDGLKKIKEMLENNELNQFLDKELQILEVRF
ncbi:hypothetical protein QYS49_16845 [Marivirga salinae]|uniref:Uncharacterized protein n=1 Tax=Marivirga salinarum TaxID=3059078 RepID=A0AA49GB41_9BACT|nr:hypothetical protein [Marivirga sp. BDSF4-3]WKK73602.2 hypothetical protein QYS49_16845 [Marivirga sp. BDSF4-3]